MSIGFSVNSLLRIIFFISSMHASLVSILGFKFFKRKSLLLLASSSIFMSSSGNSNNYYVFMCTVLP
jgi:hypothetical protein